MSPLSKLLRAAVMLALVFGPRLADAQKALVYCPVSIDATGCATIKAALLGRRAFWSGTPDQGVVSTTRPQKDALIQNLAAWAGGDFATVNAPGLVVLQDNSTNLTKRYDWVQPITGFGLVADTRLATYSAVSSLTA